MKLNLPNIRYWMDQRGMKSDADLARATGWSKATVSRVLKDSHRGIDKMRLKELAEALKRPEAELVDLDDVAQTPFQRAALERLKHADPNVRRAIHSLLNLPDDIPPDR